MPKPERRLRCLTLAQPRPRPAFLMAKVAAGPHEAPAQARTYRKLPCQPRLGTAGGLDCRPATGAGGLSVWAASRARTDALSQGHTAKESLGRLKLELGDTMTVIRRALLKVGLRSPSFSARQQSKTLDSEVLWTHLSLPCCCSCRIVSHACMLERGPSLLCLDQILHIEKRFAALHHRVTLLERDGEAAADTVASEVSLLEDLVHALAEHGRGGDEHLWIVAQDFRFCLAKSHACLCSEWFVAAFNSGMREEAQNQVHLDDVDAATCNLLRLALALGPAKIAAIQLPQVEAECDSLVQAIALAHRLLMPWMACSLAVKFATQFRKMFLGPQARAAGGT